MTPKHTQTTQQTHTALDAVNHIRDAAARIYHSNYSADGVNMISRDTAMHMAYVNYSPTVAVFGEAGFNVIHAMTIGAAIAKAVQA